MELGEKLKAARLEAGLSQKALCGDTITRNMLSQIESGRARPSMATLRCLAGRLGKPIGYFLGEESPADRAGRAYAQGQYDAALALLRDGVADGHSRLLEKLCLLELGRKALQEGRLPYARSLLEQAGQVEGAYPVPGLDRERQLLLAMAGGDAEVPNDDRALLLQAEQTLEQGDPQRAGACLAAVRDRGPRWAFLMGRCCLAAGDYEGAVPHLTAAEGEFLQALPLLEQCYRELGDYRRAYEYACKQR